MAWQFSSQQPIYQQIVDHLEMDIFSGVYAMGERLPSVRELAQLAAVNPNTMQRALAELESMGLATTQRNSGRTVTTDMEAVNRAKAEKAARLTQDFLSRMRAFGLSKEEVLALLAQQDIEEEKEHADNT